MGRIFKLLIIFTGTLVALLAVTVVIFALLFDPNDFRDNIAAEVREKTGRELVIEGDLAVSFFPWLAIEIGKTELGNAEGFGDAPFASFDSARLSVRLLPLLLRREVSVGTAALEALDLNLAVDGNGRSNWQDLIDRADAAAAVEQAPAEAAAAPPALDVASIDISNANLVYANAQLGETYRLTNLNLETGAVTAGEPVDLSGSFGFSAEPADASGTIELSLIAGFDPEQAVIRLENIDIRGDVAGATPLDFEFSAPVVVLDTGERTANVGLLALTAMDIDITANVEPFSYAESPMPAASISIAAFSPRALMQRLDVDMPDTADPAALSKLIVDAGMKVTGDSVRLDNVEIVLDDTTFTGSMVVPRSSDGNFVIELAGDRIEFARYMAPADADAAGAADEAAVPVEIPVDLIRSLNARGTLKLETATLGDYRFDDVELGINSANGKLRLHPLSAAFFDGSYRGDIRIDAAGSVPVLSADEQIENVSLGALATAMFERENITGRINGRFTLEGRGEDMAKIQQTLGGRVSFVLRDGAWEGTDVWYQLRRARALFRKQEPPVPELPPRTRFSEVSATGTVTDGILQNDDFTAELPFMRLTGQGRVDLPAAVVDYSLSARVLERPELTGEIPAAEMNDLTRAVIPLKISGPLAAPKIGVDFESIVKERAKEEIRDRVIDRLLGGDEAGPEAAGEEGAAEKPEEELDPEEELKKRLRDLLD